MKIQEFNDDGKILTKQPEMATYMQHFYQNLYTMDNLVKANEGARWDYFSNVPRVVTRGQNQMLKLEVIPHEVHKAIKSLPTEKTLGLDLIPSKFFQQSWIDIGSNIVALVKEVLDSRRLPKHLNTRHIILMLKVGDLSLITNYRPISLLSTIHKFIAKVLANRLIPNLHKWIRSLQIGFVKGRCIFDNVYLAVKAMTWTKESQQDLALILLDFEKAYDRIS